MASSLDYRKRKKRAKGIGWFVKRNAGNVQYNNAVFNHLMGADSDGGSCQQGQGDGQGMAENLQEAGYHQELLATQLIDKLQNEIAVLDDNLEREIDQYKPDMDKIDQWSNEKYNKQQQLDKLLKTWGYIYDQESTVTESLPSSLNCIDAIRRLRLSEQVDCQDCTVSELLGTKIVYHATYKPYWNSIKREGLKRGSNRNWDISDNYIYLSTDQDNAISYAKQSPNAIEQYINQIIVIKINADKLDIDKIDLDHNQMYGAQDYQVDYEDPSTWMELQYDGDIDPSCFLGVEQV